MSATATYVSSPPQIGPWVCMFCGRVLKRRGRCCSNADCKNRKTYLHYYIRKGYSGEEAYNIVQSNLNMREDLK